MAASGTTEDEQNEVLAEMKKNHSEVLAELKQLNNFHVTSSGQKWHSVKRGQVTVLTTPTLFSLRDIDTVNQEFSVELWFEAFYKDPELSGKTKREEVDWAKQWDPRIVLRNTVAVDNFMYKVNLIPVVGEDVPIVHIFRKVRATFKTKMDLRNFPFDHQKLTVQLMSGWPTKRVVFGRNYGSKDILAGDDFADAHQWDLCPYLDCEPAEKENKQFKKCDAYPLYLITAHVRRRWEFYVWNIIVIKFILLVLSFTTFSISPSKPSSRLSVTFTLLLTTVAFKLVVAQTLPTINYQTILDKYVLLCMTLQCLVAVQNATVSVVTNAWHKCLADRVSMAFLAGMVVVTHLAFGSFVWSKVRDNNEALRIIEKTYERLNTRIDLAYRKRDKSKKGETNTNMIITGFPNEEPKWTDDVVITFEKSEETCRRLHMYRSGSLCSLCPLRRLDPQELETSV